MVGDLIPLWGEFPRRDNSPLGRGGTAGDGVVLRGEAEQRN